MPSSRQIQINALLQTLVYLLGEIVRVVAELRAFNFPIKPAPQLLIREAVGAEHNDLLVTRPRGERSRATGFNTSQRDEANVVLAERILAWGGTEVPWFDAASAAREADEIPYAVAAAYFEKNFRKSPNPKSKKSIQSRRGRAYEAGRIFFEGCRLSDVTFESIEQMMAWLQGEPATRPNGKPLPCPPVEKFNGVGGGRP